MRKLALSAVLITATALLLIFAAASAAARYSQQQIIDEAQVLAEMKGLTGEQRAELISNLKAALMSPEFKEATRFRPVSAVFVFRAGEGGILLGYMKGEGLISFQAERPAQAIYLRSWSAGAQIGGSDIRGVGLVLGLNKISDFGGDYSGPIKSATAVEENTKTGILMTKYEPDGVRTNHQIFMVMSSSGLSARFAAAKLTITPGW